MPPSGGPPPLPRRPVGYSGSVAAVRGSALPGALLPLVVVPLAACGGREPPASVSPNARPDLLETLREDVAAERHPSDGGGRGRLEEVEGPVVAGGRARFRFVYEAGARGVAEGGSVYLQVPPFWGWTPPQVVDPEGLGYTTVVTEARGLRLEPSTPASPLLEVRIAGRRLEPGETIRIVYGAGPARTAVDRFAERRSPFWFAVDGDGDGVRKLVPDPPAVDVTAGPPARLVVTLPSTARPGADVPVRVAVLDSLGNAGTDFRGTLRLASSPGLRLPPAVRLEADRRGQASLTATVAEEGLYHVEAEGPGALRARSNPLLVAHDASRVLWGDLHGHSGISDGTGTPEDYFLYARDVAGLDVAALTDHDHWGIEPLAATPGLWAAIRGAVQAHHEPGRFVTLLGYEWTSWLHGHRHVLYFRDEGGVFDSVDPRYESPLQLWDALRGQPALTFAHHSAGGPVATNWGIPPDPVLEPVTEIVSVHGSSEAPDSPRLIYGAVEGNFVRDALARGYVLGFVGSGDGHDGHPGLAGLASPSAGLAAILSETLSRDAVLEALRARRVYATNGPRILLQASLDGRPMGATLPPPPGAATLAVRVVGERSLERVDIVRSGRVVEQVPGGGADCAFSREIRGLRRGESLYVRAVQEDGGTAWSSPFFVR